MNKVEDQEQLIDQPYQEKTLNFNILHRYFFIWIYRLLKIGNKRPLQQNDMYLLSVKQTSEYNYNLFEQQKIKYNSLILNLFLPFWPLILQTCILYLIVEGLILLMPIFMDRAQEFFKEDNEQDTISTMLIFAFVQFIYFILKSLIYPYLQYQWVKLSVQIQGALQLSIFNKTLKFPLSRSIQYNSGELLNMLQVDIMQASNFFMYFIQAYLLPVELILSGLVFYKTVGSKSFVPGLGAGIQAFFGLLFGYLYGLLQVRFMKAKDERMAGVDEALLFVKQIKLNSLEDYFNKRINKLRIKELKYLRYQVAMLLFVQFFQNLAVLFCWEFTFWMANTLNFQLVSLMMQNFSQVITILSNLPVYLKNLYTSSTSMSRIQKYLSQSEIQQNEIRFIQENNSIINVDQGNFDWKKIDQEDCQEFNIQFSLQVQQGQFIAIVGSSGSGKSTILKSLLKETNHISGNIEINGRVSVATQDPWIISDSIKNNITYMEQYNNDKYQKVVEVCALDIDMKKFEYGDHTILGEKGDNLSGGQQKRINLARAIYKDADIYLLDDPLSALDIKVRYQIFDQCFNKYLKQNGKTIIYFTNSFAHLQSCDKIYTIKDGQLQEFEKIELKEELQQNTDIQFEQDHYQPESIQNKESQINLIQNEDQVVGTVNKRVLYQIFQFQGGWWAIFIVVLYFLTMTGFQLIGNMQLTQKGINDNEFVRLAVKYFPIIYLPIYFAQFCIASYFLLIGIKTSKKLHYSVFSNLMHASITKFYNTILIGRLMNRLSKDIYNIDLLFPNQLQTLGTQFVSVVLPLVSSLVFLNIVVIPILLLFIVILAYLTYIYYSCLTEVTRIEAVSKSPVFSYFQQLLRGLTFVRTNLDQALLKNTYSNNVNLDLGNQLNLAGLQQWFSQTSGLITNIFQTILFIVCYIFPGNAQDMTYLILLQMSGVSSILVATATSYGNLLMYSISFERCLHLANNIEIEDYSDRNLPLTLGTEKDQAIEFDSCSYQYRVGGKDILKKLLITIHRGEKIGIVGRTGAGKSSIILALTKMIEQQEGQLYVNGINSEEYSLKTLRSQFTIIPQNPLVFKGTLKENLDPLNEHSEETIYKVSEMCKIFSFENFAENRLTAQIQVGGSNLSAGEKQLIAIARCILQKKTIILVDEATANIDQQIEIIIQELFKTHLNHCTIITIAHKVTTILESDRIMVLNNGEITELDTPQKLLGDPKSEFRQIVDLINQSEYL